VLKVAQHELRRVLDDRLGAIGLTTPQLPALTALTSAGPTSNAALARSCFVTPQTMHAIVTGLEEGGLVARGPDPDDGRKQLITIAPSGRDLVDRAGTIAAAVDEVMLAGLSGAEVGTVRRAFATMIGNLRAAPRAR
jgi:DNA-binding MarR family transcriptional regulator